MSIFTIFKRQSKRETSSSATGIADVIEEGVEASKKMASSKVSVDENTSLMVPAYLRALNAIAQRVAVIPFRYMMKKGDVYVEKEGDPYHYLTSIQMQPTMNNVQWWSQLALRTVHLGEALVFPLRIQGTPTDFIHVKPGCWSHDTTLDLYYISDLENGVYGTYREDEVLHFIWNSKDGKEGFPLWKLCKPALDIAATGDAETQKRFESGGNVMGIISNNVQQGNTGVGQYKTSNLEDLATQMQAQFRSGVRIAAVGGDAKFSSISSSSSDMQMGEQMKRVVNDIARAAGVPTYMLYVETSGTQYNTPDVAEKSFLTQTIEPMLKMIEGEFQRKLVPQKMCHRYVFRFDRDAIYALDLKSKADYYAKMQQVGAWSVNDVREKENMPKVENGDKIYVSTNMAELGSQKLAGQTTEPTAPSADPTDGADPSADPQKKEKPRDEHGRFKKR